MNFVVFVVGRHIRCSSSLVWTQPIFRLPRVVPKSLDARLVADIRDKRHNAFFQLPLLLLKLLTFRQLLLNILLKVTFYVAIICRRHALTIYIFLIMKQQYNLILITYFSLLITCLPEALAALSNIPRQKVIIKIT